MPSNLQVEKAVLGAIVLNELAIHQVVSAGIRREHFCFDSNRRIFQSMQSLVEQRKPIELLLLADQLKSTNELGTVGDVEYISSLIDGVPDYRGETLARHLAAMLDVLRDKYMRRRAMEISERLRLCAADESDPVKWSIAASQEDLLRLQGDVSKDGHRVAEFSAEVLGVIEEQMYSEREVLGLPFGIQELDEITTGIRDHELVVVGGFPGSGKTAFAVDVSRKIARQNAAVAFFSIEMQKEQILHRLWAQESGISYAKLRNPKHLSRQEFRELQETWLPHVNQLPIKIDDQASNIAEIIPRAHLYVRRDEVKLVVVDFLQRIKAPGKGEYDVVSNAIAQLTDFAKSTGVPVLCLSQLTRPDDKKHAVNVVPTMSMLRSSGWIEQNAHLILFCSRPVDEKGAPTGEDLIVVGKQRAGVTGRIKVTFDGRTQVWDTRGTPGQPAVQGAMFNGAVAN